MIVLDYCKLVDPNNPIAASYGSRDVCEEWKARIHWTDKARFIIEQVPHCGCCGSVMPEAGSLTTWESGATRCAKHYGRNPCAIEGCRRTREAPLYESGALAGEPYHADDQVLCSEHWRRYVPARSRLRRAYHGFWRQAKRQATPDNPSGWTGKLRRRFDQFWNALIRQARRRATEGHVDEAAINRLFGWDQAA